mmetsp:Transcript_23404/g.61259  ORF Transcript_23404/g.61259 Transcript_23404/m.61259 type:complete len:243 (+) Transcript_23404:1405-2133(+)
MRPLQCRRSPTSRPPASFQCSLTCPTRHPTSSSQSSDLQCTRQPARRGQAWCRTWRQTHRKHSVGIQLGRLRWPRPQARGPPRPQAALRSSAPTHTNRAWPPLVSRLRSNTGSPTWCSRSRTRNQFRHSLGCTRTPGPWRRRRTRCSLRGRSNQSAAARRVPGASRWRSGKPPRESLLWRRTSTNRRCPGSSPVSRRPWPSSRPSPGATGRQATSPPACCPPGVPCTRHRDGARRTRPRSDR